jgi:hypothetical protein
MEGMEQKKKASQCIRETGEKWGGHKWNEKMK